MMGQSVENAPSQMKAEHVVAIATAVLAVLTLLAGGTVNPTGSSLACPEAFVICHGSLFPKMVGGVLFEHGHRLIAMAVGFSQIALTVLLWRRRPSLRPLAALTLFMVCFQGLLGALTVKYQLPWAVSLAHLGHAMAYLALLIGLSWKTRTMSHQSQTFDVVTIKKWVFIASVAVIAQILLGGLVRHHEAALASLELPFHEGTLWPQNPPLPLALHLIHRMMGVLVGLVVVFCSVKIFALSPRKSLLRRLSALGPLLVFLQIFLGASVILSFRATSIAVGHFAGAVALWILCCVLWMMASNSKPADVKPLSIKQNPLHGRAAA